MIKWIYFPKSDQPPKIAKDVVAVFIKVSDQIDSSKYSFISNQVLAKLAPRLSQLGFRVETGKKKTQIIKIPVLYGMDGILEKSFDADAYHDEERMVVEVEAGRGVLNNQFLKDFFQACMMHDTAYLGIAVRNIYKKSKDFQEVVTFFDTLYASNRLRLPLKGILIIGY